MRYFFYLVLAVGLLSGFFSCSRQPQKGGQARPGESTGMPTSNEHPVVVMTTSLGVIKIELDPDRAPVTVSNFLTYVNERFYDGTIFHRVIPRFMIQGGGFEPNMKEKPTHSPIKNEAGNSLLNDEGTIAMARTGVVDSATAQFFINTADNKFLNHQDNTQQGFGYAVFGKVVEGMDVVHQIEMLKTGNVGMFENVPLEPVVIESVRVQK